MQNQSLRTGRRWLTLAVIAFLLIGALPLLVHAAPDTQPSNPWYDVSESDIVVAGPRWIVPEQYRTVGLNATDLQALLATALLEFTAAGQPSQVILELPLPEGGYGRFCIVESPIMAPELAAQVPEVRTYAGQGIDDPTATTRFDWTPAGFHAIIFGQSGTIYIDPYSGNDTEHYISYYARDFKPLGPNEFNEGPPSAEDLAMAKEIAALVASNPNTAVGPQLRTYRTAVAATGEYTQFHGGTVPLGLAAIVTTVNRVDGITAAAPNINVLAASLSSFLPAGSSTTVPFTIGNTGSADLNWSIAEINPPAP